MHRALQIGGTMKHSLVCAAAALTLVVQLAPSAFAAPPVAYNDTLVVTRDSTGDPASGTVNVLANDIDPDGDPMTVTGSSSSSVEGGTVGCTANGECTYTEPGGPCGYADSFTYTVSDGSSSADGTVNVTVECDDGGGGGGAFIERTVTLELKRHLRAKGVLSAGQAFNCVGGMAVRIQKRSSGMWKTIKTLTADNEGNFAGAIPDKKGKYRAQAPEVETQSPPDTCGQATSSAQVHRHG